MAKISNKKLYVLVDSPAPGDYLLGTDGKTGKTKNFPIEAITNNKPSKDYVDSETKRTPSSETVLQTALTTEVNRATNSENNLQSAIDTKATPTDIANAVLVEHNRANDAEVALGNAKADKTVVDTIKTDLQGKIDTINTKLISDDPAFDTLQEIVNELKKPKTNIDESGLLHKTGDETKTGTLTATKFITAGGTAEQYVKGDGSLATLTLPSATDTTDSKVLHTTGNETKEGTLEVIHRGINTAIHGFSSSGYGVSGSSDTGTGLSGSSDTGTGLMVNSNRGKIALFSRKAEFSPYYLEMASIENDGTIRAFKHATIGGTNKQYVKGDGSLEYINALTITNTSNVNYPFTLEDTIKRVVFTSVNPVTATIPADRQVAIPIGSKIEFTQQGTGVVTIADTVTIVTNISKKSVQGETRILTKIGDNTWTLEGNQVVSFEGLQRVYSAVFYYGLGDTDFKKIANFHFDPGGGNVRLNMMALGSGKIGNYIVDIIMAGEGYMVVNSLSNNYGGKEQITLRVSNQLWSGFFSLEIKFVIPFFSGGNLNVDLTTMSNATVEMSPVNLIPDIARIHEHTTQAYTQVITHS